MSRRFLKERERLSPLVGMGPSKIAATVLLAIAFPIAAPADLSKTTTDTAASGGDVLCGGSSLTPQGSATAVDVGIGAFAALSQAVMTFLPGYSKSPIPASTLKVPSWVLQAVPAGSGAMEMQNAIYTPLSASGIDTGTAAGVISFSVTSTFR